MPDIQEGQNQGLKRKDIIPYLIIPHGRKPTMNSYLQ